MIQSFGNTDKIIELYEKYYQDYYKTSTYRAHVIGFVYGLSQFITNCSFALLYYAGAEFRYHNSSIEAENIFVAIFTIFFASWAMG